MYTLSCNKVILRRDGFELNSNAQLLPVSRVRRHREQLAPPVAKARVVIALPDIARPEAAVAPPAELNALPKPAAPKPPLRQSAPNHFSKAAQAVPRAELPPKAAAAVPRAELPPQAAAIVRPMAPAMEPPAAPLPNDTEAPPPYRFPMEHGDELD